MSRFFSWINPRADIDMAHPNTPSIKRLWDYPCASEARSNPSNGPSNLQAERQDSARAYVYGVNNGVAQSLADCQSALGREIRQQHPHGQDQQQQRSHNTLQLECAANKLVHHSRQQQQQQQQHPGAQPMEYLAQGEARIMGPFKGPPDYAARSRDHIAQHSAARSLASLEPHCNELLIQDNPMVGAMASNMSIFHRNPLSSSLQPPQQEAQHSYQQDKRQPEPSEPMVLVSKSALSNLTDQIVSSMNRMKNLEDQVRVIPELQRQLDNVISDSKNSSFNGAIGGSSANKADGQQCYNRYGDGNAICSNSDNNNSGVAHHSGRSNSNSPHKSKEIKQPAIGSYKLPCVNNDNNDNISNCNSTDHINQRQRQQQQNHDELFPDKVTNHLVAGTRRGSGYDYYHSSSFRCSSTPRADDGDCLNKERQATNANSLDLSTLSVAEQSFTTHSASDQNRLDIHQYIADRIGCKQNRSTTIHELASNKLQSPMRNLNTADTRARTMEPTACRIPTSSIVHTLGNHHNEVQQQQSNFRQHTSDNFTQSNNNESRSQQTNHNPSKGECEELIDDLMSLSYSVNYNSASNSLRRSHSNARENQLGSASSNNLTPSGSNNNVVGSNSLYNHSSLIQKSNQLNQTHHNHSNKRSNSTSSSSEWKLDCGCHSFKEHLRYNTISREQRLMSQNNGGRSTANVMSSLGSRRSPQPSNTAPTTPVRQANQHLTLHQHQQVEKVDASTNTDLSMDNIVTKEELEKLVARVQAVSLSQQQQQQQQRSKVQFQAQIRDLAAMRKSNAFKTSYDASTSGGDTGSSASSASSSSRAPDEPKSSSDQEQRDSHSNSCEDEPIALTTADDHLSNKLDADDGGDEYEEEEDADEEERDDEDFENGETACVANSTNDQEDVSSLGSSCQDPSDFEEYCAYGETLDRRTRDFMSQSTKIPHDLRFALIRLNDFIKRQHSFDQIASSSGCTDVIRREWFAVAAGKESSVELVKLYVDYFESFTKQLLNTVVNLADQVGNRAIHYAASHFKLDIIDVLLQTKVCDVNCRNKAGYTPIMLLAIADITEPADQEVARRLFSVGDANIKSQGSGQTALMLAASHGRLATCKLLLECGADPSLQDCDGSTALMCASEIGHEQVVRCLLAHRLTDPNATDNDGLDAMRIAMNKGHKGVGKILYSAKNVPRMASRQASRLPTGAYGQNSVGRNQAGGGSFIGASLRKVRAKPTADVVKRADSLLGPRNSISRLMR